LVSFDEIWQTVTASCSTIANARAMQIDSRKGPRWQRS
jgi:hypothetical protein